MIYLDSAATSYYKPDEVADAVYHTIKNSGNASRGTHEVALTIDRIIFQTREKINKLFNGDTADRVVFTGNITESLNIIIKGLFNNGDHVVTTSMEHNSVLRPLYQKEKDGLELTIIPVDGYGNIDYNDFEKNIKSNTKAIICTHASNVTGNLLNIEKIGNICKKNKILFILDTAQTAGIIDINMKKCNIDILAFTGHKSLLGPQGTGGICIKNNIEILPYKVGGSGFSSHLKEHPQKFPTALEAGTLNGCGISGLNAAITWLESQELSALKRKEDELMWCFYDEIKNMPEIKIYGDFANKDRCAIVSFNYKDYDSGIVGDYLWENFQIACRTGVHCAPLMHESLGTDSQGTVRISFSHFNTKDQVKILIDAIKSIED
ncbi:aminotransferase class V-fold PLP-dependent enzyme [Fusobacterium sp. PH5-44]|uniref:aminotransferase class V-fold PLP-dependent enzyme n=1 Tax=unclassified Fusobacterium TaxID=2648384 RepID=UPI003D20322E